MRIEWLFPPAVLLWLLALLLACLGRGRVISRTALAAGTLLVAIATLLQMATGTAMPSLTAPWGVVGHLRFTLAPGAVEEAVARLGSDRGVTRRELEKLALYAHGQQQIGPEDIRAVMGDESQARSESAFDAAGSGDFVRLDLELERLWVADIQPAQVIRGAMGHFQRLMLAKEGMARGEQIDTVMRKFFPPIHFSRADSFKAQARNWNAERLADALDMLLDAEGLSRTTAVPAHAVTGRTLLNIAALAKAR